MIMSSQRSGVFILRLVYSVHQIYVGTDSEKQPFFVSVVLNDSNNQGVPQYKAILWKKTVRMKQRTTK